MRVETTSVVEIFIFDGNEGRCEMVEMEYMLDRAKQNI